MELLCTKQMVPVKPLTHRCYNFAAISMLLALTFYWGTKAFAEENKKIQSSWLGIAIGDECFSLAWLNFDSVKLRYQLVIWWKPLTLTKSDLMRTENIRAWSFNSVRVLMVPVLFQCDLFKWRSQRDCVQQGQHFIILFCCQCFDQDPLINVTWFRFVCMMMMIWICMFAVCAPNV